MRKISRKKQNGLPAAQHRLRLMTWNIGYAGLGKESDFVSDGGTHLFPPSRAIVRKNLKLITQFLGRQDCDVLLLQEVARAGPLTRGVDVFHALDRCLDACDRSAFADILTPYFPPPIRISHGASTYSRLSVQSALVEWLPFEPGASAFPGVRRRNGALITRIPIANSAAHWTLINIHLSAFDEKAAVRRKQLLAVMDLAQSAYDNGDHVVVGGDWNLVLAQTRFESTTEDRYLFWIYPFPEESLPANWSIVCDPSVPTVRTNERPYRPGENFTTVIDGYIVSPNVVAESVKGIDLHFEGTDHHPVLAQLHTAL